MKNIFFFIGTEAELIKLFPVILECKKRNLTYHIIASGQNNINHSQIFSKTDCGKIDLELSQESSIRKSAAGLLQWWIKTYKSAAKQIREAFNGNSFNDAYMIVHGDTVSTYMGARIGRKLGMTVCHIEAGLRSHNLFSPFPEEIDRLLTSSISRVHFAPGKEAYDNLNKAKGEVIDTVQNTLLDSLRVSKTIPIANAKIQELIGLDYFVFVMHRQENLVSKKFVLEVIDEIIKASERRKCVILLHKITENALIKYGLMDKIKANGNIITLPRVEYFDFMKLLDNAKYVITDGGSNQEELYYMGKPCLLLRAVTERKEGLGKNARLFDGNASDIGKFINEFNNTQTERDLLDVEPSKMIVDFLITH